MRNAFVKALARRAQSDEKLVFLTGDLGFAMLEPLREALGDRFINAGIAEQNMLSVAAGLCKAGMRPWVYSIAPFVYARAFEQIRNDICLHGLPVRIIGGGGGFGYGTAGPTHHAIEDCGVMSALRNITVYAPSFASDIEVLVGVLSNGQSPTYIRLARDEMPRGVSAPEAFGVFRELAIGRRGLIIGLGAMACVAWDVHLNTPEDLRPSVWACSALPFGSDALGAALRTQIENADWVMVLEDHVTSGGLGEHLAKVILENGLRVRRFFHRCVQGYPSGLVGSQDFHREENGISGEAVKKFVESLNDLARAGAINDERA